MKMAKNIKGLYNQRCHTNAFKHSKQYGSDIYVGYHVEVIKGEIYAIPHFWNVKDDDTIIDISLGSNNDHYYGRKVTKNHKNANKLFDEELLPLYKKGKIDNIEKLKSVIDEYGLIKLI